MFDVREQLFKLQQRTTFDEQHIKQHKIVFSPEQHIEQNSTASELSEHNVEQSSAGNGPLQQNIERTNNAHGPPMGGMWLRVML